MYHSTPMAACISVNGKWPHSGVHYMLLVPLYLLLLTRLFFLPEVFFRSVFFIFSEHLELLRLSFIILHLSLVILGLNFSYS